MTEYSNENRGVLFKNDNKTEDYHGDYTGSINIGGTEHFLDAYLKTSKAGKKFFSLKIGKAKSIKRPDEPPPPPTFDDDLDLPF